MATGGLKEVERTMSTSSDDDFNPGVGKHPWKEVSRGVEKGQDEQGDVVYRVELPSRGLVATTKNFTRARTMADAEAIISSSKRK